ncbi:MAG: cell division protein, partial [Bacteroidota bacterium]
MPSIHLTTFIAAPVERVFDLSRSITLHKISASHTDEKAIAGITSGLINVNET